MESLNQVGKLQTPNILEAWENSWQAYIADSLLLHTGMHALNYHPEPTSRSSTCTLIASSAKAFRKTDVLQRERLGTERRLRFA